MIFFLFFFPPEGIQGQASKYLYLSCKDIELPSGEWTLPVSSLSNTESAFSLQSTTYCKRWDMHANILNIV